MNEKESQSLNERPEQVNEFLSILARGEGEIAAGLDYDLDAVLTETDALLAEESVIPT